VVFEVHKGGGIAFLAGKEMLIDTQYARAGSIGHLRALDLKVALIPALYRCCTDLVGFGQLALGDTTIVGFIHLQLKGFRSTISGPDTDKRMPEIASAGLAMVLGYPQVQGHHLVTLARVFDRPPVGGLNP